MKKPSTNKHTKVDWHVKYIAVNRATGEETPDLHPKDLPEEKRLEIIDRFAAALGYERVMDAEPHPPPIAVS